MFPGMSEAEFATFFVVAKQDKIKQYLNIEHLYTDMAVKIVYKFVLKNEIDIQNKFTNQYDSLFDENFFMIIINLLKNAKDQGIPLQYNMK